PVAANPAVPVGQSIASLAAAASDVDGDTLGIAVTAASGIGTWQFSLNGSDWADLGQPSATSARLLGPTALVRFVPAGGASGATLTFRAWDQSSGVSGGVASTTLPGTTAFSTLTGTAVVGVNAAPALAHANPALTMSEDLAVNN